MIVAPLTVVPATTAPVVFTVLPEKAPPVKLAAFTHPAAVENPVPAVIVAPLTVVPAKVPPLKAAPVNPPANKVPVKLEAVMYPGVVKPLCAVKVVPETVPPIKAPPVKVEAVA